MKRIFQVIIQIIIIGGLLYYFYNNRDELHRISKIPLNHVFALIGLIFIGNLVRSAQLRKFINILGSQIAYFQSVWLTVGCTLLNYLPMNIGMIVKARELKNSLGIRYAHFVSLSSVDVLLTMISGASMGLIVSILSWNTIGQDRIHTILFFLVVLNSYSNFFLFILYQGYKNRDET